MGKACDATCAAFLPNPPPPRDPIRSAEPIEPLDSGKSRSFALEKLEDSTEGSQQFLIGIERNLVAIIHVPAKGSTDAEKLLSDRCQNPTHALNQGMCREWRSVPAGARNRVVIADWRQANASRVVPRPSDWRLRAAARHGAATREQDRAQVRKR